MSLIHKVVPSSVSSLSSIPENRDEVARRDRREDLHLR